MTDKHSNVRDEIVAGIIYDKQFDIPVDIYDMVTENVVKLLFHKIRKNIIDHEKWLMNQYSSNPAVKAFFDYVRETIPKDSKNLSDYYPGAEQVLTFNRQDWLTVRKKAKEWWFNALFLASVNGKAFDEQSVTIMDIMLTYDYRVDTLESCLKMKESLETTVRVFYMMKFNEQYNKCMECINNNIPVLYYDPDVTDIWMYLKVVLSSGYRGILDNTIEACFDKLRGDSEIRAEIEALLLEIGMCLNQGNLKYYFRFTQHRQISSWRFIDLLNNSDKGVHGWKMSDGGYIKNFNDIVEICGNNQYGLSTEIQETFLMHGGDIETMFDENGNLLNEASILKMIDKLPRIFSIINDEQLRFLLLNSANFVKNILTSKELTAIQYIRIAKALLVVPIDENLWKVINDPDRDENNDYRARLINHIEVSIGKEMLFDDLPESMMYIEPSVLYVSRQLSEKNFPYIPVSKLVPYIRPYIGRHPEYKQLNLFCKGDYVSITSAINDDEFLIGEIVRDKKYGYICDIQTDNLTELVNQIAKLIEDETR